MKLEVKVDPNKEEKITIECHEENDLVKQIKNLVEGSDIQLNGYLDDEIIPLKLNKIERFFVESNKVFASVDKKHFVIKYRIYQLEEALGETFVKINQSCLVNVNSIVKFKAAFDGSIMVELASGEKDYISRRSLKNVKERLGF